MFAVGLLVGLGDLSIVVVDLEDVVVVAIAVTVVVALEPIRSACQFLNPAAVSANVLNKGPINTSYSSFCCL